MTTSRNSLKIITLIVLFVLFAITYFFFKSIPGFTICAIITTIAFYCFNTDRSDILKFNSVSTLIQTVLTIAAIGFTVFTIVDSDKSTNRLFGNLSKFDTTFSRMDSSLGNVSNKLKEMPKGIEAFTSSITDLNKVVRLQREDFIESTTSLNTTIGSLAKSVKDYENNINTYGSQLDAIVKQTDKQLLIWKEQQRVILSEYMRRPKLSIVANRVDYEGDTCIVRDIIIQNTGDIYAEYFVIILMIDKEYFYAEKGDDFKPLIIGNSQDSVIHYQWSANLAKAIASPLSRTLIKTTMRVRRDTKNISYQINYFSPYDQSGIQVGNIILNL